MRMYLYYALHSFLGVLRKLFRTWVAVLIAVCVLFGVVVGVIAATVENALEGEPSTQEDFLPEELEEDLDLIREEAASTVPAAAELAAGGLVLLLLGLNIFTGEKSGSHIFTMADVNLLFPSPHKPQSILLFRMATKLGTYVFLTLYMGFQVPNLVNLGLSGPVILSLFPTWFFLLVFSQLLGILTYTLAACYEKLRALIRPAVYVVLAVIAGSFYVFLRAKDLGLWEGAVAFFNAPAGRFIPLWGWIKAIPFLVLEEKWLWLGLDILSLVAVTLLLVRWIWSVNADFYEDALSFASELEAARQAALETGKGVVRVRKKERKTRDRELSLAGEGAPVFFHKTLYNRFRLAKLGLFTKTGSTYLVVALGMGALARFIVHSNSILLLTVPLMIVIFIRSLGNPIAEDSGKTFFLMIPEKTWKKVFWSHLGGSVNTLLDLVPAFLIGVLLVGCDPLRSVLWLLFLTTLDFYAASFGVFADFILPDAIPQQIKATIQILMIYFSVAPVGILLLVGLILHDPFLFLPLATGVDLLIGFALTAWSGAILEAGRK